MGRKLVLATRMTASERALVQAAAAMEQINLSSFLRSAALVRANERMRQQLVDLGAAEENHG